MLGCRANVMSLVASGISSAWVSELVSERARKVYSHSLGPIDTSSAISQTSLSGRIATDSQKSQLKRPYTISEEPE